MISATATPLVWIPPRRLSALLVLLSLDLAAQAWPELGVLERDPERLRRLLREHVAAALRLTRAAPTGQNDFVVRALAAIIAMFGEPLASSLITLSRETFARGPHDQPDVLTWRHLFVRCRHDPAAWEELGLTSDARVRNALDRALDLSDVATLPPVLTSWDLAMFVVRRARPEDRASEDSPLAWLEATIAVVRTRALLREIALHFDPVTERAFVARANSAARTVGLVAPGYVTRAMNLTWKDPSHARSRTRPRSYGGEIARSGAARWRSARSRRAPVRRGGGPRPQEHGRGGRGA
jgi:hypothetical protein